MDLRSHLLAGHVIPAQPLALDRNRKFSEKHQRALTRYYVAAGSGGLAVGVHSTQFEIRDPQHNLFKPVLELAARTVREELAVSPRNFALIAGICGQTKQATAEAELALSLGYQAGLVSMAAFKTEREDVIVAHKCRPAKGGQVNRKLDVLNDAQVPGHVARGRHFTLVHLPVANRQCVQIVSIAPRHRARRVRVQPAAQEKN